MTKVKGVRDVLFRQTNKQNIMTKVKGVRDVLFRQTNKQNIKCGQMCP